MSVKELSIAAGTTSGSGIVESRSLPATPADRRALAQAPPEAARAGDAKKNPGPT